MADAFMTHLPGQLSQAPLKALAERYGVRAIDDAPFTPLPLADQAIEEDEAALKARMRQLSYEVPASQWRPIPCQGEPSHPPRRFIDGSVFSRTVAVFTVEGRRRPAILACVGALALQLEGRRLARPAGSLRLETILCLLSNGRRWRRTWQLPVASVRCMVGWPNSSVGAGFRRSSWTQQFTASLI